MDQYILDSERVADEITKAYYKASKRIESQMIKTIQGLSALSDSRTAIKALIQDPDAKALKSLRRAVSALPEGQEKQEALTLLSSPAYQFRLRRLQATIDNARRECEKLYKVELKDTTRRLRQCYNSAFTHTIYDIDKGFNTLHTFSMFPASRVNTLLRSRWSGKNYSDRIWNSTNKLADTLKEQLLVSFMTGSGVTEAAAAIREEFQTSAHAARRLVRTETNFIANQSELDAYKRLGIEEYRYIATLDTRTSDICQSLDNQVFKIDDAKAGVNLPPMHPNCRSTTIMHDAEEPLKERIAKDENGKSIYVPGNMSYSQWLQKYHPELVDKLGGNGIIKEKSKKSIALITDQAINRVPFIDISGLSREQNEIIQKYHKELLEYSRTQNNHNEVSFVFPLNNFEDKKIFTGSDDTINFGNNLYGNNLIMLHNHPRNSSFSLNDVSEFLYNESLKIITIVKNNGNVEVLSKSGIYDAKKALTELDRDVKNKVKSGKDSEYNAVIQKFLKRYEEKGVLKWLK
ncbi:MAG: minor capsid protein [Prevotella sp.]|nr:minor capsid protein [Prevotella sp.]